MSKLVVGCPAPVFSLLNQRGERVNSADFRHKKNIVIFFYPKALTPGCTVQACGMRDINAAAKELDTVIFGISPDGVAKLKKFDEKYDLGFDLLSDEDTAVAQLFDVYGLKKFMGREYMGIIRTSFFIDKQGLLVKVFTDIKTKNHHDVVMSYIKCDS